MTKLNWQIVDRYFAGEATTAERVLVEQWLSRSARFRALVEELYRGALDDETIRHAAADVRARLERDLVNGPAVADWPTAVPVSIARHYRLTALKAAAAVAIVLGGMLIYRHVALTGGPATSEETLQVISAPPGQSVPVMLSDGSKIVLSPGSTMRYAVAMLATMTRRREVHLEGQAYFAVRHDVARPFVVRAGDLVVEDLGTEFVVRAYPEDLHGRVIVRRGLVGLAGMVIMPGQGGHIGVDGAAIVEPADTASWFAWTSGHLVLARMPLRDALPTLSRWYDVQFHLADPALGAIELAGQLPSQFGDDASSALELALGLKLSRSGRVLTFHAIEPANK